MMRSMTKNAMIELDRSQRRVEHRGMGTGPKAKARGYRDSGNAHGVRRDKPQMGGQSTGVGWVEVWRET